MEYRQNETITRAYEPSLLSTHRVLRNTYFLLSLTLIFSAITAGYAMVSHAAPVGPILTMVGMFGLLFLTQALRNSAWGLLSIFLFTGFVGYTLGPLLNLFITHFANGEQIVLTALAGTGGIFLALSGYTLVTRKDFSFLGGFLFIALIGILIASIVGMFFQVPMMQMVITCAGILVASGLILFDTSRIIYGGETNYIMATIQLYLDVYMLFVNLLSLLGMSNNRD